MDAYETLRQRARSKRETAIRKAQAECRAALRKINELERKVGAGGDAPAECNKSKGERLNALVLQLIPRDRPFTMAEVTAALKAAEPKRRFPIPSVRAAFRRLADQDVIRPTKRGYAAEVTFVASSDPKPPTPPFAALSLPEAAMVVLRERGPMRDVELALEIQRRGLRPADPQIRIVKSLYVALRRNTSGKFRCGDDEKWHLVL